MCAHFFPASLMHSSVGGFFYFVSSFKQTKVYLSRFTFPNTTLRIYHFQLEHTFFFCIYTDYRNIRDATKVTSKSVCMHAVCTRSAHIFIWLDFTSDCTSFCTQANTFDVHVNANAVLICWHASSTANLIYRR